MDNFQKQIPTSSYTRNILLFLTSALTRMLISLINTSTSQKITHHKLEKDKLAANSSTAIDPFHQILFTIYK